MGGFLILGAWRAVFLKVPVEILSISPTVNPWAELRWTADGRALTYIDIRKGISNIWSQTLEGGSLKQLTDFKSEQIYHFDWSRDGRQLALARGTVTSDVVM